MTDFGIAIDRLRPGALYTHYESYADLVRTYAPENPLPLPSEAELDTAYAEWEAEQSALAVIEARQVNAHDDFATLPGWATWTITELNTYIDTNIGDDAIDAITNLAEAKVMLKLMANIILREGQAIIYLRNHTMPDLEGSS